MSEKNKGLVFAPSLGEEKAKPKVPDEYFSYKIRKPGDPGRRPKTPGAINAGNSNCRGSEVPVSPAKSSASAATQPGPETTKAQKRQEGMGIY